MGDLITSFVLIGTVFLADGSSFIAYDSEFETKQECVKAARERAAGAGDEVSRTFTDGTQRILRRIDFECVEFGNGPWPDYSEPFFSERRRFNQHERY